MHPSFTRRSIPYNTGRPGIVGRQEIVEVAATASPLQRRNRPRSRRDRKKHPSTDPANSLLSLGYVMLGNEIAAVLEARGFDPAVGFLHGLRYGRSSLALDVVEPFRQPVIDRLTLRLLNLRQLSAEDFEGGQTGLRLSPEAFKRYLALYEDQLRSESEGKGTPTWRERLRLQVDDLKEMVMTGQPAPFYTWRD
jgi:CRISPR-associated protein Cas1